VRADTGARLAATRARAGARPRRGPVEPLVGSWDGQAAGRSLDGPTLPPNGRTVLETATVSILEIGAAQEGDRAPAEALLRDRWGEVLVVHDTEYPLVNLAMWVAKEAGDLLGIATYNVDDRGLEIITLDSLREGRSIGRSLVQALTDEARRLAMRRVWMITTNENLQALAFFQRRGFRIVRVDVGAADRARAKKRTIPEQIDGIPIHDELELELVLD
jgi:N-acetylglutamate synthase-like GNAT family acetyltransferase